MRYYLTPSNERVQIYCRIYLWFSLFTAMAWSAFMVYIFMGDGKDGEYCIYTQDLNNYHIIFDGESCLLQWRIVFEFLLLAIAILIPAQTPVWIVFLYLKYRQKKRPGNR